MHSCPWCFRHIHLRTRFNAEVKSLEQASEREVRHLQSVGNPRARSPPGAERDELKMPPGGVHLSVGGQESLGHELLRVTPHPGVSVQLPSVHPPTLQSCMASCGTSTGAGGYRRSVSLTMAWRYGKLSTSESSTHPPLPTWASISSWARFIASPLFSNRESVQVKWAAVVGGLDNGFLRVTVITGELIVDNGKHDVDEIPIIGAAVQPPPPLHVFVNPNLKNAIRFLKVPLHGLNIALKIYPLKQRKRNGVVQNKLGVQIHMIFDSINNPLRLLEIRAIIVYYQIRISLPGHNLQNDI
nr:hypothetical protein KK1_024650 [Ipomoea batatas]